MIKSTSNINPLKLTGRIIIGLLCFMFLVSAIWSLSDYSGTIVVTEKIGYPGFIVLPLAIAKLLGIAAIIYGRWPTLKTFAYAGFLYDLILATLGHYHHPGVDTGIGLAIFGLVLWVCAYVLDTLIAGLPKNV